MQPASGGRRLDPSSRKLSGLIKVFKLTDTFRLMHPMRPGFTRTGGSGVSQSRIDFLFVSAKVRRDSVGIEPFSILDHKLVVAKFQVPGGLRLGRGIWRMNTGLLADGKVTVDFIRRCEEWRSLLGCFGTMAEWWGIIKGQIRDFFQAYSRRRGVRNELREWNDRLERAHKLLELGFPVMSEIRQR